MAHFVVGHAPKQVLDHEIVNGAAPDERLQLNLPQKFLPRRTLQFRQLFKVAVEAVGSYYNIRLEGAVFLNLLQLFSYERVRIGVHARGDHLKVLAGAMRLVKVLFEKSRVMRVVIDAPALRRGVAERHHAEFAFLLEREVGRVAHSLMIDGDRQVVIDRHRTARLRNPKQPLIWTIDGVVSVAEKPQHQLKGQAETEKPSQFPPETTLSLNIPTCHERSFLA